MKQINFNELPVSKEVREIISSRECRIKYKTKKEVLREYQDEKWGELLADVKIDNNISFDRYHRIMESFSEENCFFLNDRFYVGTGEEIFKAHLKLYIDTIKPYISKASCLVELGAGYGSKILNISQYKEFDSIPLYAGEFTNSGIELISIFAKTMGIDIKTGYCDFGEMIIDGINIPENSIIFTSYATPYVPEISNDFIKFLSKLNPLIVIHFEPCYEHYQLDTIHGLMCREYIKSNDYNKNLVSVLQNGEVNNEISINTNKNVIGSNPLLPISILSWKPVY